MGNHSPGSWEARNVAGAGWEIFADVSATMGEGFSKLVMIYGSAAIQPPTFQIAYERWVQFPKLDWERMQEANAVLMASAPDMLAALEDAEFILRKLAINPAEVGQMVDTLARAASDVRGVISKARGESC